MRLVILLALALPSIAHAQLPQPPASDILIVARDAASVPSVAAYVRYLTLYNIPPQDRLQAIHILNGHLQHLSREQDIVPAYVVPNTANGLLRINLKDYRWDTKVWESLADQDPYFHVGVQKVAATPSGLVEGEGELIYWPGGVWPDDGKYYPPRSFTTRGPPRLIREADVKTWPGGVWKGDGKHYPAGAFTYFDTAKVVKAQVKAQAPIRAISPIFTETAEYTAALEIAVRLTQSQVPLLRADWWFNQTATSADGRDYYKFLGIKTEKDFQKLGGFDAKLAENFVELRDALALSGVTLQPRAVVRNAAVGGSYWRTFDFKVAKDETDPLRIIGRDIEKKHDASEQYIVLPNGFWATGAFDGKGVAQETVPDTIASDSRSRSNDRRIAANVGCLRCHGGGGLQELDQAWFRSLIDNRVVFNFPDYDKAREFRQQYVSRKLAPFIAKDGANFEAAVRGATGFKTGLEYTQAYARFWEKYEDAKVNLAWAARDLNVPEKFLRDAIIAQAVTLQSDTVILGLGAGRSVSIRQWEQSFNLAYITVRQFKGK